MLSCGACGNELTEFDRFCGACGAPAPPPPQRGRRVIAAIAVFAAAALGLAAIAAGGYYALAQRDKPHASVRLALGQLKLLGPEPEPSPAATDTAKPVDEEKPAQPAETPSPSPSADAAPSDTPTQDSATDKAKPSDKGIAAGLWSFTTELFNVTKVDMSDRSFQLSRQGVGTKESNSQCVTKAIASNPSGNAFPFRSGLECLPITFTMADNQYRSRMTCNFPQYGGRRQVDVIGQYTSESIALEMRVRVPAQVVIGDFQRAPEIYMHYRMQGARTGPC